MLTITVGTCGPSGIWTALVEEYAAFSGLKMVTEFGFKVKKL